jgi:serine/threonine protein phosphatase PrpC
MMMPMESYVRRGKRMVRKAVSQPRLRSWAEKTGYFLCGLLLSAASLGNSALPLPLALLCAGITGVPGMLVAAGGCLGYWIFWDGVGGQGPAWMALGLVLSTLLGGKKLTRHMPLLMPALAAATVAFTGLLFQLLGTATDSVTVYLLRIALATGAARVFAIALKRRDPVVDWLACALVVLALAQVAPLPILSLGFLAAGMLGSHAPFPAAALAGLALDLARITDTPMTAVLSLAFFVRLIPGLPKWTGYTAPAVMYLVVAPLCGVTDYSPVFSLALGSALGNLLPPQTPIAHRRGETGMAQVRLELAAGAFSQTEQILSELSEYPIDEAALIEKAAERACGCCPCRKGCQDQASVGKLSPALLHRPLVTVEDLPLSCRKRGRVLLEMRRSQDQYRAIRADRDRQQEYRQAVIQQYRFLCDYLRDLSDQLPRRGKPLGQHYRPEVSVCSAGLESANGDRCLWFAGTQCRYYILLCDGMGTGIGAEAEGKTAASLLKRLLTAGYPAEYALRSLNSLCTLRGSAGAVTVDLAQIDLETGKVELYKWGAAPSYLLSDGVAEKIGTAGTPPGLSVTQCRETVDKLSLRRGETLILLSDGVDGEAAMRRASELTLLTPGEMASKVLQYGKGNGSDDATAAVIRLYPQALST